jgi:hypothetical protein
MTRNQPLSSDMLKGTLDMMILRTLSTGDAHGHTIAKVIERTSEDVLEVEQGSLYPALHRLKTAAGSPATGVRARTTAKPSTTASPPPAGAVSRSKPAAGVRWRAP